MTAVTRVMVEQGWGARPFAEQFPGLKPERAELLERMNRGITDLYMTGLLTDSEKDRARKRLTDYVSRELGKIGAPK